MKLLAISDEEVPSIYSGRIRENFGDVDLVLGCGDLPFYYLEFVVTMLDKPVYYVLGNHDKPKQFMADGRIATHAEGCIDIDGRMAREGQLIIAGFGGSIRYKPEGDNQYTEWEMLRRVLPLVPRLLFNRIVHGRYLDILITHAPPRGIHDEDDHVHRGFRVFNWFIRRFHPRFMLHGHTHKYRRNKLYRTWYERTEVINVHPYKLIDWEGPAA